MVDFAIRLKDDRHYDGGKFVVRRHIAHLMSNYSFLPLRRKPFKYIIPRRDS